MGKMDFVQKKKIVCGVMFLLCLTLLCLFTNLFGFYKSFLLGTFGLVTYPAVILGIAFCVLFLANKVVRIDKKGFILSIIIFALFLCVLQLALTSGYNFKSFSSYISDCYTTKTTPAGIIIGCIIYPIKYILFDVGAYVVFSVAIITLIAYLIDYYVDKHNKGQATAKLEKMQKPDPIQELRDNVRQTPKSFADYQKQESGVENQSTDTTEKAVDKLDDVVAGNNNTENVQNSKFENENKLINEKIKAQLGLKNQGYSQNLEQEEVDKELDGKSEAYKTLYPDKFRKTKNINTLNTNYLSNSLNRYFEDETSTKKSKNDEYKEKYKDYTIQKVDVGYEYLNSGVTNSNSGIISGDAYKEEKKDNFKKNIVSDKDKQQANQMFETMKEPPKHYNTEEIHYDGCTILKDGDGYEYYEPDFDVVENQDENEEIQFTKENFVGKQEYNDYQQDSNMEVLKQEAKPVLKVDEEESGVNLESFDSTEDEIKATILPNSEDLTINRECESQNQIDDDKLIEDFEEVQINTNINQTYSENDAFEEESEEDDETLEQIQDIDEAEQEIVIDDEKITTNTDYESKSANQFAKVEQKQEEQKEEVYIPLKPYNKPPVEFLTVESTDMSELIEDTERKSGLLEQVLESFKVPAKVSNVVVGPTVTRYEMIMPVGISVKRIIGYSDDIAMTLASRGAIRIEAPIPGKNAVGVEVPNEKSAVIGFREALESEEFRNDKNPLTFVLGKDINGKFKFCNIAKAPHLIIAGSTGSGKSVCLNILLLSIIYKSSPEDVRIVLVDPKRVEFANYAGLPHLMIPQIITEANKAADVLQWAINEMEKRYTLFQSHRVRDIGEYNSLDDIVNKKKPKMPYIIILLDEFADLMSEAKKDIEDKIARLAAKARSAGMHIIIATQRPSVDVITGTIKNNFPTRIAFSLTTAIDSKTVIDQGGAEKLLGHGDMLYSPQGQSEPTRIQAPFVTAKEIDNIVDYVKSHNEARYDSNVESQILNKSGNVPNAIGMRDPTEDDMFIPALKWFIEYGQASSSMLQRRLGIGWNRAAKLTDAIEELGYIGKAEGNGGKRPVLITKEQFRNLYGDID